MRSRSPENSNQRYVKSVYSAPLTLDPAQMDDTASLVASNLLYDGLFSFSPTLEIKGAIAESWSTSTDGRVLHFHLKPGARFQNGTEITALDAVASFSRLIAPESKVFSYYDCIEGAAEYHQRKSSEVSGLRATSERDLEIRLKAPFPPFLSVLAGGTAKILPQDLQKHRDFFKHPIGSGPFRYIETKKTAVGTDVVLKRFMDYSGTAPKISELVLRATDETTAREQAKKGLVHDLANWPLTGQEEVFQSGQHLEAPVAATWIIGLNARVAPFNHPETRRAFHDSLDTESFRKRFYPDALPSYGYIPPGLPGFKNSEKKQNQTSSRTVSKQLIQIAFPKGLTRGREMQSDLEKSFRDKGWNVRVIEMPWDKLMQGYAAKTLQAFLVSMNMDYPDTEFLVRSFESTNPDNFSGIHDPEVDGLIRKARGTQDRIIRDDLYRKLVSRLEMLAPTINLFHPRTHLWASRCVRGLEPNLLADVYIDYRNVSIDPGCSDRKFAAK